MILREIFFLQQSLLSSSHGKESQRSHNSKTRRRPTWDDTGIYDIVRSRTHSNNFGTGLWLLQIPLSIRCCFTPRHIKQGRHQRIGHGNLQVRQQSCTKIFRRDIPTRCYGYAIIPRHDFGETTRAGINPIVCKAHFRQGCWHE